MSLAFLHFYLQQKGKEGPELSTHLQEELGSSSQEMRTRQAAYNTIKVESAHRIGSIDFSRNKVQALANDHALVIDWASSEVDISFGYEVFEQEVQKLPEGAFLIRMLKPEANDKLEACGHALVYIKEKGSALFYDPNRGTKILPLDPQELYRELDSCFREFGVKKTRFYRMVERKNTSCP